MQNNPSQKISRYFSDKNSLAKNSNPRPFYSKNQSENIEGLFKEKMTREELKDLEKLHYNPLFKNGLNTCTIRTPSGHQKVYTYNEKERIYIKAV